MEYISGTVNKYCDKNTNYANKWNYIKALQHKTLFQLNMQQWCHTILDSPNRNNLADENTSPILPERMEPRLQNKTKENCQSNKREFAAIFFFYL